jgi:hypothetical protein
MTAAAMSPFFNLISATASDRDNAGSRHAGKREPDLGY